MQYKLCMPNNVIIGANTRNQIVDIIAREKAKRVLLLTDAGVYGTGRIDELVAELANFNVLIISDIPPEPSYSQVADIYSRAFSFRSEINIAIGGGSVMDTAKLVSAMLTNTGFAENMLDVQRIQHESIPTVMIPTTAGTGSEATQNAIVLIEESKIKQGIIHENFIPKYVVLDAVLTMTVPPQITAATGIDALCHSVETMISKKTNTICKVLSLKAIQLIVDNLRRCYENGNDLEARENMLLAAFFGGVCINTSSTVAIHALAYPLGGAHHIPHGVSNAMLMAEVMKFNRPYCIKELSEVADILRINGETDEEKSLKVINAFCALVRDVNIPTKLSDYGVLKEDIEFLSNSAMQVTRLLSQNPREMTLDDIKEIYKKLF